MKAIAMSVSQLHIVAMSVSILLAGCAGRVPPPAIEAHVVRVEVPVAISCVKASDIPTAPAKIGGLLNGDAGHDLPVVAASAVRLRAYAAQLAALLGGCVLP